MKLQIREQLFRIWYWYVNKIDKQAEILFMNFGYCDQDQMPVLDKHSEPDRYSTQLYHHLVCAADIKNKDIVEVGCGRGGGLAYVTKNFSPASALGVDLDKEAAAFCNRHYSLDGLSFLQGDAQNLALESNSCDVVLNVESSHRYPDMKAFLSEVVRILRPDGCFLFTDFRYKWEIEELESQIASSGMIIEREMVINKQVVLALELDDERKRRLVRKLVPKFLHKTALNFAGTIGSETYNQFVSGEYVYVSYVLKCNVTAY